MALAYLYASSVHSPDSDFSHIGSFLEPNALASEAWKLTTTTIPITAIYGYSLRNAGVFDTAESFANATPNTYIGRQQQAIHRIYTQAVDAGQSIDNLFIRTVPLRISIASRRIFSVSAVWVLQMLFQILILLT